MFHCLIGIDGVDEKYWNLAIVELEVLEVCCNYVDLITFGQRSFLSTENILSCYKLLSVKIFIGHSYQGQLSFIKSF
jgi:hypothetical protein